MASRKLSPFREAPINCLWSHQGLWESGESEMQMLVSGTVHLKKAKSRISIFKDKFQYFNFVWGYAVDREMKRLGGHMFEERWAYEIQRCNPPCPLQEV